MTRFFKPYEGEAYCNGVANGHRLLLVGESHYNEPDCPECGPGATREVVECYLAGTTVPFFDHLERAASGNRLNLGSTEFWRSVAFANFIQRPMQSVQTRPSSNDYASGLESFWETISELSPDMVFMFTSAWNYLPNDAPSAFKGSGSAVGDENSWLWRYKLADRDVLVARFNHPSARHNPPITVWKAWADFCWKALENNGG